MVIKQEWSLFIKWRSVSKGPWENFLRCYGLGFLGNRLLGGLFVIKKSTGKCSHGQYLWQVEGSTSGYTKKWNCDVIATNALGHHMGSSQPGTGLRNCPNYSKCIKIFIPLPLPYHCIVKSLDIPSRCDKIKIAPFSRMPSTLKLFLVRVVHQHSQQLEK